MRNRKVRRSQTIVPFGVGAILNTAQGESLVACDVSRWGPRGDVVVSARLSAALGGVEFRAAPVVQDRARFTTAQSDGIPYRRFPSWLFCPKCRRMDRWRPGRETGDAPTCESCPQRVELVPMRWIQICAAGHMDDVDWGRWAHSQAKDHGARQCQKPSLLFETVAGRSAGPASLRVRCKTCGSFRSLSGISGRGSMKTINVTCTGRQPWQSWSDRDESCSDVPLVVQRGSGNVHFPVVVSSIEVPDSNASIAETPEARAIRADPWYRPLLELNEGAPQEAPVLEILADTHGVGVEVVAALLRVDRLGRGAAGQEQPTAPVDLLQDEWIAFSDPESQPRTSDFAVRREELLTPEVVPSFLVLDQLISKVVLVDRLREVRALQGFHRVTPGGRERMVLANLGAVRWLPAVEVRGEGLFIEFEESSLSAWESIPQVAERAIALESRLSGSFLETSLRERVGEEVSARYVLLHTFSHLLMRRLAFESGYSASSIKERLYARSFSGDVSAKAGVLIYTAAGDAEGTLGGLVRLGEPPRLATAMIEALQDAMWCSSDPLCAESSASSLASLNLAACHSCSLVSETSCESGNFLLDRALVVGADGVPGYFQAIVEAVIKDAGATGGVRG